MSLQPTSIYGYNSGGLKTNKKPFLIEDQAFQKLNNAYPYRERVVKREGIQLLGRLKRTVTAGSLGMTVLNQTTYTFNTIFSTLSIMGENPEIVPGSLVITIGDTDNASFTDQGDGTFIVTGKGVAAGSYINYSSGNVVIHLTGADGGAAITADLDYYPSLPVMGIWQRDQATINDEQTIWFDQKYAYIYDGTEFQEFIPGTSWNGTNSDFFWCTNYRGVTPQDRYFFATNFVANTSNPMRYTDGTTWTNFVPCINGNSSQNVIAGNIEGSGITFNGVLSNPPIAPNSVTITVAGITFTDPTGSGTLTGNPNTNTGTINYTTGAFTLNFSPTIIFTKTISNITKANPGVVTSNSHDLTTGAQLTITGVVGMTQVNNMTYTVTVIDANTFSIGVDTSAYGAYVSGGSWSLTNASTNVVASYETQSNFLFSARILIPYYGRLLALNTWEGSSVGSSANIFNRCRFSQLGSPVAADAWREDIFGKGGFLDAPTNEAITSARFIKNTLLVSFEQSTWQLRYVGEYGLPFIWERVAADLGSVSTFSSVYFDKGVLMVGDKGIIAGDSSGVERIDLDIPDQIFNFSNSNNGVLRVWGVRDYKRELVFWNYSYAEASSLALSDIIYPNRVLVFNYRNNTWANFRDNVTAFGTIQNPNDITWDSQTVTWDDSILKWDDADEQTLFPFITSGNQEGFVHLYGYKTPDDPSLSITGVDLTTTPIKLTIVNHNLEFGDIIYVTGLQFINSSTFLPITTDLNDNFYQVQVVDANTIGLFKWNSTDQAYEINFDFTPDPSQALYIGGGQVTLFPKLEVQTKDFNIYQTQGLQTKLSYIDFLMAATPSAAMNIILFINSSPSVRGNLLVGNQNASTSLTNPFYPPASDYAWHRFYATAFGQYFNVFMTYSDDQMNNLDTHRQTWELNAMTTWTRPGGKLIF